MDNPPEVELVLPCLDEVGGLRWLLPRVPAGIAVILADNGSTDGSGEIARQYGARVVDVPQRGYGAACHAGLLAASADIVVVMDADGSLDPAQLDRVLDPVRDGRLDLVIELPVRKPTCCVFGGKDLSTLFITTSRLGETPEDLAREPLAGALFAIRPGVSGYEDQPFAG